MWKICTGKFVAPDVYSNIHPNVETQQCCVSTSDGRNGRNGRTVAIIITMEYIHIHVQIQKHIPDRIDAVKGLGLRVAGRVFCDGVRLRSSARVRGYCFRENGFK